MVSIRGLRRRLLPVAGVLLAGLPASAAPAGAGAAPAVAATAPVASGSPRGAATAAPAATGAPARSVTTTTAAASAPAPAAGALTIGPFRVGAAREDITPDLATMSPFYLGGYGIGPVHQAKGVLRHIYARVIAVGDAAGHQVVIGALDNQGHFLAYQQGAYGFADVASDIQASLHIPASNILLQSTHTHNGPDDLGIWGGVPNTYLALVKSQTERAIREAVAAEQPVSLVAATADMTGFSGTFGPNDDSSNTGDARDYPMDQQMRVLQAVDAAGNVVATLVNYSTHATVYGPLDRVSPDWPGATATFLEHDEIGIPASTPYGYPGSVAVVTVGAVGHTWPAGTPRGTDPAVDPAPGTDNHDADVYGNAVARVAIDALSTSARAVGGAGVAGAMRTLDIAGDNALLDATLVPNPVLHAYRADTPPYGVPGGLLITRAQALRIGDIAVLSAPGEEYPSLVASLRREVHAALLVPMSLAADQLGYIEEPGDYNGALQCSLTDEGFFTISPSFGLQLEEAQRANAAELRFAVDWPGPAHLEAGRVPPPTACTVQQLPAPPALPVPAAAPAATAPYAAAPALRRTAR